MNTSYVVFYAVKGIHFFVVFFGRGREKVTFNFFEVTNKMKRERESASVHHGSLFNTNRGLCRLIPLFCTGTA